MINRIVARARVKLTIEMPVGSTWGPDCPIAQIHSQAVESALGRLRNKGTLDYSIIGEPEVTAILVTEEKL